MSKDQKQKFLPDDYVFKQGERGDKAYLLLDGRVAIEVNGKKVGINTHLTNKIFYEALLDGQIIDIKKAGNVINIFSFNLGMII